MDGKGGCSTWFRSFGIQRHSSRRSEGARLLKFKVFLLLISSIKEYATMRVAGLVTRLKYFGFYLLIVFICCQLANHNRLRASLITFISFFRVFSTLNNCIG